jgi:transketolase
VQKYKEENAEQGALLSLMLSGELPANWEEHLPTFADAKPIATRVASGEVINALAPGHADVDWRLGRPGSFEQHLT